MCDAPEKVRRDWRIPDDLWEYIQRLIPPRKPRPLGCHRPRVDDRRAMDAICFVLRTGWQWNALQDTGLCSSSSAHRRFQEWAAAGVFLAFWEQGLAVYEALQGIEWEWLVMEGAMTKAPLGGETGVSASGVCLYHLQTIRPIGIGSKGIRRAYRPSS
jgi:putative transposase